MSSPETSPEKAPKADTKRLRKIGGNVLRIGGGLVTFGLSTAAGYKIGTDIFAPNAPSKLFEYAYTGAGVILGMIGGGYAGTLVATSNPSESTIFKHVSAIGPPGKNSSPKPETPTPEAPVEYGPPSPATQEAALPAQEQLPPAASAEPAA